MFISPIDLVIVLAAMGFGGFYCWAQQRGLLTSGQAAEGEAGTRRISLLTEAAAYTEEGLKLAQQLGDFSLAAMTYSTLSAIAMRQGDLTQGRLADGRTRRGHEREAARRRAASSLEAR